MIFFSGKITNISSSVNSVKFGLNAKDFINKKSKYSELFFQVSVLVFFVCSYIVPDLVDLKSRNSCIKAVVVFLGR